MSTGEPLAGRPFPLGRGLVLRNRLVGTAHAAISEGRAAAEAIRASRPRTPATAVPA